MLDAVALLSHRGSDLIVFHLLDPAELRFPFDQPATYEDLESGERIPVVPDAARARYARWWPTHIATLSRVLGREPHRLRASSTPRSPSTTRWLSYLSRRERLVRSR